MRNPSQEELSPVLEKIERLADIMNDAQALEAQLRHDVHVLKRACGVPRDPGVVLDDQRHIWVRVSGKTESGQPVTQPLIDAE